MRKILLSTLALAISLISFGQHQHTATCGSDRVNNKMFNQDPAKFKAMEKNLQRYIKSKKRTKSADQVYTIPLVIHIIHTGEAVGVGNNISDAQITSGVQQLNDAFRNTGGNGNDVKIQFQLATQDPNCQATTGINRVDGSGVSGYSSDGVQLNSAGADEQTIKALSKWDNNSYYNIWLVSEFDGNNGGSGVQGFAYFPGASSAVDGAMIMNTAWGNQGTANSWNNQGKTGIHEIGHALNLYHTFEGDNDGNSCPSQTNGCGSGVGDCCSDTEPHIRSNSTCPSGTNACTGAAWAGTQNNYMDYSSQNCQFKFTTEQIARMRAALENNRSGLINSKGLETPVAFTAPSASNCTPVTSSTGMNNLFCALTNVTLGSLNHTSSYPNVDGASTNGYYDKSGDCLLGIQLTEGTQQYLKFTVGVNTNNVSAWIDYNNNDTFDSGELLGSKTSIASNVTDSIAFTVPTDATEQTWLRLRVIVDLVNAGAISGPCHNPTYGQAEDYSIYINPSATVPDAAFTPSKFQACVNDSIVFTDNSTNSPTSWKWTVSGPESKSATTQNATFTFGTNGVYTIELIATNSAGSDTITQSNLIAIHSNPTVNLGADQEVCNGTCVTFDAGAASSYSWSGAGSGTTQSVQACVSGDYIVEITDANGCSDTDTVTLTVNQNPAVDLGQDTGYCPDSCITLDAGPYTSFAWSGQGSGSTQTVQACAAGDYIVNVTDAKGCTGADTVNVVVYSVAAFDLGNDVVRCAGQGLIPIDAGAGWASYNWLDGFSSAQVFSMMVPGNHWCHVKDANGCEARDTIVFSESTLDVTADQNFDNTHGINAPDVTLDFGQPVGGKYYYAGGEVTTFDPSTGVGNHDIKYIYTDSDNCTDSVTVTIVVDNPTGLHTLTGVSNLVVLPNPSTGKFAVQFSNQSSEIIMYQLTDLQGKIVEKGSFSNIGEVRKDFDISKLTKGVYQLSLINSGGSATISVVKK